MNLIVVGNLDLIIQCFGARWDKAETINFSTCLKTGKAFLFDNEYRYSPVSSLFLDGRQQLGQRYAALAAPSMNPDLDHLAQSCHSCCVMRPTQLAPGPRRPWRLFPCPDKHQADAMGNFQTPRILLVPDKPLHDAHHSPFRFSFPFQ